MGYSKKWDFHYTDRKDYEYKYHKALRKTAKGREQVKKSNRLTTKKRYNLTNEQYEELWKEPWCHICGITQEELNLRHCLLYTSPSPRDLSTSRMPSSA